MVYDRIRIFDYLSLYVFMKKSTTWNIPTNQLLGRFAQIEYLGRFAQINYSAHILLIFSPIAGQLSCIRLVMNDIFIDLVEFFIDLVPPMAMMSKNGHDDNKKAMD